jgi:hypothetical protein
VQNADFTGWNLTGTMALLAGAGWTSNVQYQMLSAGLIAKTFYVYDADNPNFVANFLQSIANDINTCNSCLYYGCSAAGSCLAPQNICDCQGNKYPPTTPPSQYTYQTDKNGVCCLLSQLDCAGLCNGGHTQTTTAQPSTTDATCGVCVASGSSVPTCVKVRRASRPPPAARRRGAPFRPRPPLTPPRARPGLHRHVLPERAAGRRPAVHQHHPAVVGRLPGQQPHRAEHGRVQLVDGHAGQRAVQHRRPLPGPLLLHARLRQLRRQRRRRRSGLHRHRHGRRLRDLLLHQAGGRPGGVRLGPVPRRCVRAGGRGLGGCGRC